MKGVLSVLFVTLAKESGGQFLAGMTAGGLAGRTLSFSMVRCVCPVSAPVSAFDFAAASIPIPLRSWTWFRFGVHFVNTSGPSVAILPAFDMFEAC